MLDLLSLKVLEITRQRLLGVPASQIFIDYPELQLSDGESLLNYGNQGSAYYFDYNIELGDDSSRGIEGSVSETTFTICEYTNGSTSSISNLDISSLSSYIGEDEFFQYSLVVDIGELTVEQLRAILVIRDIIKDSKVEWGIK